MSTYSERLFLARLIRRLYHSDHVELGRRTDEEHGEQHVVRVRYLEQVFDFGATSRFDPEKVAYWVKPSENGYELRINAGFL